MNKKIEPKFNQNKNNFKGFTIIEVVLVLAIAGLIFLMVFLGLPALQRAQRDTQRKQDVAMVVTALHNWKANNRGRGYAALGNSKLEENTTQDDYDRENGINKRIDSIENNPLNNYVGFRTDNNSNKNDSSSLLSLNTSFIKTYTNSGTIVRFPNAFFEEKRSIAVVIDQGCNNMETFKNGDVTLKDRKPGTAAVIHSLESGGAYCQEA